MGFSGLASQKKCFEGANSKVIISWCFLIRIKVRDVGNFYYFNTCGSLLIQPPLPPPKRGKRSEHGEAAVFAG